MIFMVSFVALMVERFFDWGHLRQWGWFQQLQALFIHRIPGVPAYVVLVLSTLPVLVVVSVISFILSDALYGMATLIWQVVLLLVSFGPKNLWAQNFANRTVAADESEAHESVSVVLVKANQRIFSALFWFVLLGPCGALFYRMISVTREAQAEGLQQAAVQLESILAWLPIRLMSLFFALGGNFNKTIEFWVKNIKMSPSQNQVFIVGCGDAAIGVQEIDSDQFNPKNTQYALALIDRVLVITLIILIIWSIAA